MTPEPIDYYRHGQAMQIVMQLEKAIEALPSVYSVFADLSEAQLKELRELDHEIAQVLERDLQPKIDRLKGHVRSILPD